MDDERLPDHTDERDDSHSMAVYHTDPALEGNLTASWPMMFLLVIAVLHFTLLSSLNISRVSLNYQELDHIRMSTDGGHVFWRVTKLVVQGYEKAVT